MSSDLSPLEYQDPLSAHGQTRLIIVTWLRLAKTIYTRCIYGDFGREITNIRSYTVYIYGSGQPYTWLNDKQILEEGSCRHLPNSSGLLTTSIDDSCCYFGTHSKTLFNRRSVVCSCKTPIIIKSRKYKIAHS
jgi:hypothetical protein